MSTLPDGTRLPPRLASFERRALVAGLLGLAVCFLFMLASSSWRTQSFRWYLWAYLDWLGVALGCLVVLMIQHLTGGAWGMALRRLLEAAARTLPLLALLFVPLAFGLQELYPWADPDVVARDPNLQHKAIYLSPGPVLLRVPIYFAIWIGLAYLLNRWSRQEPASADAEFTRRFRLLSAPGIGIYGLAITFAAIDWVMSLEPHWYSTIYGPMFAMGQVNAGFAFALMMALLLRNEQALIPAMSRSVMRDCGNLLLAFVMVWTYLAFSQFLLIWSGNLPEETSWYIARSSGIWLWVAIALVVFHFAVPFALLLSRDVKRDPGRLAAVACLVLCMEALNLLWLIMPAFAGRDSEGTDSGIAALVLGVAAQIGVGATWLAVFLWQLGKQPLAPAIGAEATGHD